MNYPLKAKTNMRNPALVHKFKGIKSDQEIKSYVIKRLYAEFQNEMRQIEEEQEEILNELADLKKNE